MSLNFKFVYVRALNFFDKNRSSGVSVGFFLLGIDAHSDATVYIRHLNTFL